jgi:hypothetical protein
VQAPLTPPGTPVVNALAKQRAALTNIFRACVGLEPESDMTLEHKLFYASTDERLVTLVTVTAMAGNYFLK